MYSAKEFWKLNRPNGWAALALGCAAFLCSVPGLHAQTHVVYIANTGGHSVSAFTADAKSGELREISGSPYPTGNTPTAVALAAGDRFLYVANQTTHNLSAFEIDPRTGALKTIPRSPFPGDAAVIQADRAGKFLYALQPDPVAVLVFAINPSTGALTRVAGSPFAAKGSPTMPGQSMGMALDPLGRFLYVSNLITRTINVFSTDNSSGGLSPLPASTFTFPAPAGQPATLSIDPTGRFAIVTSVLPGGAAVWSFSIDSKTGALKLVGSPQGMGSGAHPIVMDSSGQFVYVVDGGGVSVAAFRLDSGSGALTPVAGSPFLAINMDGYPTFAALDPSEKILYVCSGGHDVSIFFRDPATGVLKITDIKPVGDQMSAIAAGGAKLAISPAAGPVSAGKLQPDKAPGTDPVSVQLAYAKDAVKDPNFPYPSGNFDILVNVFGGKFGGINMNWIYQGETAIPFVNLRNSDPASETKYLGFDDRGTWLDYRGSSRSDLILVYSARIRRLEKGADSLDGVPKDLQNPSCEIQKHWKQRCSEKLLTKPGYSVEEPDHSQPAKTRPSQAENAQTARNKAAMAGAGDLSKTLPATMANAGTAQGGTQTSQKLGGSPGDSQNITGKNASVNAGTLTFTAADGSKKTFKVVRPPGGAAAGVTGAWFAIDDGFMFTVQTDNSVSGAKMPDQAYQMLKQVVQQQR